MDPRRRLLALFAVLVVPLALFACGDDDDDGFVAPEPEFVLRFQNGELPSPAYDRNLDVRIGPASSSGGETVSELGRTGTDLNRILVFFGNLDAYLPDVVEVKRAVISWQTPLTEVEDFRIVAHAVTRGWSPTAATWTNFAPGGAGTWTEPGGDFDPEILDEVVLDGRVRSLEIELPSSLVESWIADPVTNYGIILRAPDANPDENLRLTMGDDGTGFQPVLTIVHGR